MFDVIDMLTQDGKLTEAAAHRIRGETAGGKALDDALREDGNLSEDQLLKSLAQILEMPYTELETINPSKEFLAEFPVRVLLERHMIPLSEDDGVTSVAMSRVFDTTGLDELRLVLRAAPGGEQPVDAVPGIAEHLGDAPGAQT